MKLYLFGGAEADQNQVPTLKQMFNDVLAELKPKQLLHIPYARIEVPKGEEEIWGEGWVKRDLKLDNIELLDARNKADLDKADNPVIFANGGHQRDNIYEQIINNKQLYHLVTNASYYIGESSGSMVCGEYRRTYRNNQGLTVKGLGLVRDTIFEVHYSERNRHQALRDEIKKTGLKYGLGIDSITAAVIDTDTYPEKYQKIGDGLVDFVKKQDL